MASALTLAPAELTPQLVRLFHAAGLLSEADWQAYGAAHERHKPILDVLTAPVSLDSFKDLFNAEITFKSKKRVGDESALHRELSGASLTNNQEMADLLANFKRTTAEVVEPLRRDGVVGEALAAQLASDARLNLVGPESIQAEMLNDWLTGVKYQINREAAFYLAIYLARENDLLSAADFNKLVQQLAAEGMQSAHERATGEFGLTSARISAELEKGLRVPQVRLEAIAPDEALVAKFPQNLIRRHTFLPLGSTAQFIAIATADPFNLTLTAFLRWATGLWPEPAFASGRDLIDAINDFYSGNRSAEARAAAADPPTPIPLPKISTKTDAADGDGASAPVAARKPAKSAAAKPTPPPTRQEPARRREEPIITDNVSAVQLVSSLIESAIELRTTDIHIEPTRDGLNVRFRIDGELHRIMSVPASLAQPVVSRIKVLAEMDVTERRRPQDGHFELKIEGHNFDFRISTLPAVMGEKLVIRILDTAQVKTGLEDLGLLPKQRQMVDWMLARQHGMILVTGPTGSGKTSTLYAALNKLNQENRNLVTIEDPVEYQLAGINQVNVNADIGMTFSEGLRAILRQDPDIIMVGEIRDADTARNALRAATTGHLVLSTLHTNTALGSVDALVQMGSAPFSLGHALLGILSQRLVRKLCTHCRKGYSMKDDMARQLGLEAPPKKRIYKAAGCPECLGSGYFGRSGVFEVIRLTEVLRGKIANQEPQDALERACREQEMLGIHQAGLEKVLAGETSAEEIMRKIMMDV